MNKIKSVLFTAGISLALGFTFGCSSDDDGGSCNISGYRTVKIGEQTWMAENLNCNVSGSICYNGVYEDSTKFCHYNEKSNCDKYGRLYDWKAAMGDAWSENNVKHRGICPSGWHIPSKADWDKLISYVENVNGCSGCAGKYLKATSDWNEGGNGLDTYGFSALPGGFGHPCLHFAKIGEIGSWLSSNFSFNSTYYLSMVYNSEYVELRERDAGGPYYYSSVRCIQD